MEAGRHCSCVIRAAEGVSSEAGPEGPAQTAYAHENGAGPVIVVISGQTGPTSYQKYAAELSDLGYYSVLLTSILKEFSGY